ncbi:MAG: exodeoxyribonuclease V subunit beta, partial [Myxococcales bacterium]
MSDDRLFEVADAPLSPGIHLVEASAGTGKTYSLVGLVLRALLEGKVASVDQVLVVTFTNAATDELITRIRESIVRALAAFERGEVPADALLRGLVARHADNGARTLRAALRDFDRIGVSTIHSFCHRVLIETAFESGTPYDVELLDDASPLLERAAHDFWRTRLYGLDGAVAALVAQAKLTPASLLVDYELWKRHRNTRIVPKARPLDEVITPLAAAVARLRESWDRGPVEELLGKLTFRKNTGFGDNERGGLLDALDAFGAGADGHVTVAARFTTTEITESQYKRGRTDPPYEIAAIDACDALFAARADLAHALRCEFIADVDQRLDRIKREAAVWSHDDLIRRLRQALDDKERTRAVARVVARKYHIAFIDEFQDTDLDQYEIFRKLFPERPVYLIGDPKQAIYGFRGADVYAYLKAKQDAVAATTLRRNRRSTEALVHAVNGLFSARDHAFAEERILFQNAVPGEESVAPIEGDDGRPLEWMWLGEHSSKAEGERTTVAATVDEIVALLDGSARIDGRAIEPQDIAVLVGRHTEARAVRTALAVAGVPAVQRRCGDIHDSEEMTELARVATAVVDPASVSRVKAALSTRLWGLGPQQIREVGDDENEWQDVVELLAMRRDIWLERGFMRMIGSLAARLAIRPRLAAYEDGDRRLTNFRHAAEILHQAELEQHLSPAGLLRWRAREKQRTRGGRDAAELRIEREVQSVEIATLHASKGLQYEIVFCPFLWSAKALEPGKPALRHADLDQVEMDCAPDKGGEFLTAADNERLGQDVRLAYVALTRARRRCYVGFGRIGRAAGAGALVHLLDIDRSGDASAFEDGMRRLTDAHAGTMRSRDLSERTGPPQRTAIVAEPRSLAARSLAASCRERLRPWQVVSFSALAGGGGAEIPDRLDPSSPSARAGPTSLAEEGVDGGRGMFGFARGACAGTCLHEILEHVDLAEVTRPTTKTIVARHLERHGLGAPGRHRAGASVDSPGGAYDPAAEVAAMLGRLAQAEVPGEGFRLADARNVSNEWQFYIPMAGLSPSRLAAVFAAHGGGGLAGRYASALERLESASVRGFLVGFVDTVLSHGDRWYLVDWKSNYLGDAFTDYAPAELERAMIEADYVLQYHLYSLGLHRYLRSRLPGYDYDRNFGGALYVFLRGIRDSGATGWFHDRPSRALIDALDTFFETGQM